MSEIEYYYNWNEFKDVYLEDSFVLDIIEDDQSIIFKIEAVLTKNHPLYKEPNIGEAYCYRQAEIEFLNLSFIKWITKNSSLISIDANDEPDLGNIDCFYKDKDGYHLEGDWGILQIQCNDLKLRFYNNH